MATLNIYTYKMPLPPKLLELFDMHLEKRSNSQKRKHLPIQVSDSAFFLHSEEITHDTHHELLSMNVVSRFETKASLAAEPHARNSVAFDFSSMYAYRGLTPPSLQKA